MSTDLTALPWRTGRHFPRHMYAQIGEEPSDADPYVGTLETAELADEACAAHNTMLDLRWMIDAGWQVQFGRYAGDRGGATPFWVHLVNRSLRMKTFDGANSGEAILRAREWSEREEITP